MKRWKLIAILYDEDHDVIEATQYGFNTYFECMEYRELLMIECSQDPEIYDYKFTVVNS